MALCSESTGVKVTPYSRTMDMMIWPAQTRVSLLARAIFLRASMAAMVGLMPIMPTTATTVVSASGQAAAFMRPSMPLNTGRSRR